jgi:hypothetical protein
MPFLSGAPTMSHSNIRPEFPGATGDAGDHKIVRGMSAEIDFDPADLVFSEDEKTSQPNHEKHALADVRA